MNEDALGEDKEMMVSKTEEDCILNIDGEDIETVKKLKYLGAMISSDGLFDEEIEQCSKGGGCYEEGGT